MGYEIAAGITKSSGVPDTVYRILGVLQRRAAWGRGRGALARASPRGESLPVYSKFRNFPKI